MPITVIIHDYAGVIGNDKTVTVTDQYMVNLYLSYGKTELSKMGVTLLDNDAEQSGGEV